MEQESNPLNEQVNDELVNKAMAICDMVGLSSKSKEYVRSNEMMMQMIIDNPEAINEGVIKSVMIMDETL